MTKEEALEILEMCASYAPELRTCFACGKVKLSGYCCRQCGDVSSDKVDKDAAIEVIRDALQ